MVDAVSSALTPFSRISILRALQAELLQASTANAAAAVSVKASRQYRIPGSELFNNTVNQFAALAVAKQSLLNRVEQLELDNIDAIANLAFEQYCNQIINRYIVKASIEETANQAVVEIVDNGDWASPAVRRHRSELISIIEQIIATPQGELTYRTIMQLISSGVYVYKDGGNSFAKQLMHFMTNFDNGSPSQTLVIAAIETAIQHYNDDNTVIDEMLS